MCNSHNHTQPCNCGFGEGRNRSFSRKSNYYNNFNFNQKIDYAQKVVDIFKPKEFSLTIPNAKCPVCGEKVFFYQNIYGSRVFFDSLGIPWPKHPCTDNKTYSSKGNLTKDIYSHDFFLIPEKNGDILNKNINPNIFKRIFTSEFYDNDYGKTLFKFKNIEYLLLNEFSNKPDIIILILRDSQYSLETYEILSENYESIKLHTKDTTDLNNIKHFKIENGDIIEIKINCCMYDSKEINLYKIELIHYGISKEMKLENFLEEKRDRIRFMKYISDKKFNKFKVRFVDSEFFEIE